jgi:hypothetical protein
LSGPAIIFDEAVEMVMEWMAARIETGEKACATGAPQERGEQGNSKSLSFAPQLSWIRESAQEEAVRLKREIEFRFVRTGEIEVRPYPLGFRESPHEYIQCVYQVPRGFDESV